LSLRAQLLGVEDLFRRSRSIALLVMDLSRVYDVMRTAIDRQAKKRPNL